VAKPGYVFKSWSGDVTSAQNPINVTMGDSLTLTANFAPDDGSDPGPSHGGNPNGWHMIEGLLTSEGYVRTSFAGEADFYATPAAGVQAYAAEATTATLVASFIYPAADVTGSPRIWIDGAAHVLSRQAYGPYGEQLGIFPDAMVSDVGYAGYVDDRNTTGLMYTPNRYLSLKASFMSVDPSGSINLHDPRTFNQYAYVAGNPLRYIDPLGLYIVEEESALSSRHYTKIRDIFLSYPAGRQEWEKWNARTDLTIHMKYSSTEGNTDTTNYQFNEAGKLVSADIVFGPNSGGRADPIYPDRYRFGLSLTDKTALIIYTFAHEFGHVADAETEDTAKLIRLVQSYYAGYSEWKSIHPKAPIQQFFVDRPDLAKVWQTQLGQSHYEDVLEPHADRYAQNFFISNGLQRAVK
jgi:RHS repeat-associated protein/uncharacterized repeat protein (TIGR02543 family)